MRRAMGTRGPRGQPAPDHGPGEDSMVRPRASTEVVRVGRRGRPWSADA